MLSTWSGSYQLLTSMHLALWTLPRCSEAATSFLHLQMVGSTLMALQCLIVKVMQTTGGVIISTGERLKSV